MTTAIDFATLDLRAALDFAILVEEDAQLRYERLSRLFVEDRGGAGAVFRAMIGMEASHRAQLMKKRAEILGSDAPAIEVSALDVSVEGLDLDDDLPATAHEALRAAIAAEQRAHDFFARAVPSIADGAARDFFLDLQREELEHRDILTARLAALGPEPEVAPPRQARAEPSREAIPPDAADLCQVLPRVDAATRAIAAGILFEGLARCEVADALGVSPGTVARKWHGFLRAARHHIALGLATATLAGCAGPLAERAVAPAPAAGTAGVAAPAAATSADRALATATAEPPQRRPTQPQGDGSGVTAQVHAHVAARMPRVDASTRRRIAQAVINEARDAMLDPLLVLAIIHVESSFRPDAVSHAGAVGLMQLREPTFRREVERSRIPGEPDPTDPVTNVRAGVRYLRRLVDAFGDVDVALMAYNAGPNRIGGHLRRGGIPERYFSYPQKVTRELERLRSAAGTRNAVAASPDALTRAG